MTEDLIKLFECESSFEIRKEIRNLTDDLKLDLLVELNRTYYFEYFFNKLSEQVNKVPNESDEVFKKRKIEEGFEDFIELTNVFPNENAEEFKKAINEKRIKKFESSLSFTHYSLKNGLLESSEVEIKNENVSLESYENLKSESYTFEKILNKYLKEIYQNQNIQSEPEAIDLSDTTATEKIIYLHKLGVIDFLRKQQPFQSSINSLATILSAVTGEKSGTIQSMLNAMLSKNVNDKNNPLNSRKPTNKVTQQLNQIGFNSNETI